MELLVWAAERSAEEKDTNLVLIVAAIFFYGMGFAAARFLRTVPITAMIVVALLTGVGSALVMSVFFRPFNLVVFGVIWVASFVAILALVRPGGNDS